MPLTRPDQAPPRYQVLERIDVGGMAEVFKGKLISMEGFERLVAIKRVHPNLVENEKFLRMFLDEAKLSLALNHANIVQVFDLGHASDTYFIVMEYVDGTNLKTVLETLAARDMRMQIEHALYIMMEVCKGLAHAHQKRDLQGRYLGIVHRDISPPNVLLSTEGEVKLTDFGLAKARSQVELTDPGIVKGKFGYLSPEAAYGHEVDALADVFACGVVLWEMLSGRRLFRAETDMQTLELVRRAEIPSLTDINPDVPKELDEICMRAMARDKAARWRGAQELGQQVAGVLFSQNTAITAYDVSTLVRQVLRFTKLQGGQSGNPNVTHLVQAEIDRIMRIEQDAIEIGNDDRLQAIRQDNTTREQPAVEFLEDPRTWADWSDESADFDTIGPGDAAAAADWRPPTPIGVQPDERDVHGDDGLPRRQPEISEETMRAAWPQLGEQADSPPPVPEATAAEEAVTGPLPSAPTSDEVDIFASVTPPGSPSSSAAELAASTASPIVTTGAKILVISVFAVILVLGMVLFYILTTR